MACLRCLLAAPLSHAPSLSDHVCEYAKVGKCDQRDYPDRLGPAGDIVASKEVAKDRDEQPEPDNEDEYCEDVHYKIAESETFCEEEHRDSPLSIGRAYLRASRIACAVLVACDTRPIIAGGTRMCRRRFGSARMPSPAVFSVGRRAGN